MSASAAAVETTATTDVPKKKKKLSFPTAFTILFALTIIAAIATWFVPSGEYAKLSYDSEAAMLQYKSPTGEVTQYEPTQAELDKLGVGIKIEEFTSGHLYKPVSVPGTYERLESNPRGFGDVFTSMVHGTIEAADVMVFIMILGGMIGLINVTGSFEAGLLALTKKTKGREFALVFIVSLLMAIGGTTCGLEEEAVAFYPILVPVFLALGYDSIICVGAIFLASSMGTTMSTINPFSVVIASNAAGISFTDGIEWRIAGLVVGFIVVIAYLYWYAKKIKENPSFSYTWEDREHFKKLYEVDNSGSDAHNFSIRKKIILVLFVASFIIMVWGVMSAGWGFPTMAASFLTIAIAIMFIGGLPERVAVDSFIAGASGMVGVSLIIGLARGINLILNEGLIADTLLDWSSHAVQGLPGPAFVLMLLVIFFGLGFIVPSSSGLAVLSMPILAPLADTVGLPRFVVECAYQWGQYAMLYLAPTGLVLATLQMLDMKYSHWLKFVWPMVAFVLVFGGAMLVTQSIVYGA